MRPQPPGGAGNSARSTTKSATAATTVAAATTTAAPTAPTSLDPLPTIVLDLGGGSLKVGYGGEDAPRRQVPTVLGTPRHPGVGGIMMGAKQDAYVGQEALDRRGVLGLTRPMDRRRVVDWAAMDSLLYHALYVELLAAPDDHPVMLLDAPDTPRADRERLAELLFETYNMPAAVVANQACAALASSGRSTGLVVDSGEGASHVVPVWEGYTLPHYSRKVELGGADVTDHLVTLLREKGLPFSSVQDRQAAERIKETLCYSCLDYDAELKNTRISRKYERSCALPDGSEITLVDDRFSGPEVLFNPSLLGDAGSNVQGLHTAVHGCVQMCDPFTRPEFFSNIFLSGGNTLFAGMSERLAKEVHTLAPSATVKTVALPERRYSAWLGGYDIYIIPPLLPSHEPPPHTHSSRVTSLSIFLFFPAHPPMCFTARNEGYAAGATRIQ